MGAAPSSPTGLKPQRRLGAARKRTVRVIGGLVFFLALGAFAIGYCCYYYFGLRSIPASGGLYFVQRYELPQGRRYALLGPPP